MSAFTGAHGKGAARKRRELKRAQAVDRSAATPLERTAAFRRKRAQVQAAIAEWRESESVVK